VSHRDGDVFVVASEPEAVCDLCGNTAELRPYGPNGENVCHPCGVKDRATMERHVRERLGGAKVVVLSNGDVVELEVLRKESKS